MRYAPLDIDRVKSRSVLRRCRVHQGPIVDWRGIEHSRAMVRNPLDRSAGRRHAPDVPLAHGRNSFGKVDVASIRRPRQKMTMHAGFVDINLPRVTEVPVGDKNRIAACESVVGHAASVRRSRGA
jgi:hypothetical protein